MIVKIFTVWILWIYVLIIANGYIEEKNGNKYLIFDSVDENKELLKKHNDILNGIKNKIKEVDDSECDYKKKRLHEKWNLILMIIYH